MAAIARLRAFVQPLKALSNRAFGSAAAVQCYYDDDDEEEEFAQCVVPNTMLDAQGSAPERGVQWVMIGEPGAKRHLFAERLSKLLEVPHISMGTLLRQELNPRSSLYQQIANALDQGKLVPEEIIFGLLSKRLEDGYSRGETGFILDGIPRTRIQAEILDHIARVDLVVNFKCSEENLVKKNLGTRKFSPCQEYIFMRCSMTPTNQLQDEHVHNHAEEVTTYISMKSLIWFMIKISEDKEGLGSPLESKLLEDYYRKQKKLLNFEVGGAPGETWQGLLAALHLQHINALSSSQKLTA